MIALRREADFCRRRYARPGPKLARTPAVRYNSRQAMTLLEIAKLPTPENSAIILHATDNVAVARVPLSPAQKLRVNGVEIVVLDSIPAGHKVALREIGSGEPVRRYGQVIGRAKERIEQGRYIHTHNLAFEEGTREFHFPEGDLGFPPLPKDIPTFQG